MSLLEKIKRTAVQNRDFILASLVYASASFADYIATLNGIRLNKIREMNPLLNSYTDLFGAEYGLLIPKIIFFIGVVSAAKYVDYRNKSGETKWKAEYILYPGALMTGGIGLSWIVQEGIERLL